MVTRSDLNKAFDLYDADPILGHSDGSSPQGYSVIVDNAGRGAGSTSNSSNKPSSSGDQNLMYVPQERLIDLRPFALGPSPPVMASEPGVQATWLAVEGHFYPGLAHELIFGRLHPEQVDREAKSQSAKTNHRKLK